MAAVAYQPEEKCISPAEYLTIERDTGLRHELINGRLYPMGGDIAGAPVARAGASFPHVAITSNLVVALGIRLRGGACVLFTKLAGEDSAKRELRLPRCFGAMWRIAVR
ncbi:MAG: putative restriction endonuclease [Abditibacteriota bacterium]|nr:putative restriction endonuclease [Abditibacteriota bacterium]